MILPLLHMIFILDICITTSSQSPKVLQVATWFEIFLINLLKILWSLLVTWIPSKYEFWWHLLGLQARLEYYVDMFELVSKVTCPLDILKRMFFAPLNKVKDRFFVLLFFSQNVGIIKLFLSSQDQESNRVSWPPHYLMKPTGNF